MDFELAADEIKKLQKRIDLRTSAEQRVEYLISKGMVEEALRLLAVFERRGFFDE